MKLLLSGVVLFSGVLYAAFNPGVWAFRREVKAVPAPFDVLSLDADVYRTSKARLDDLRLIRSGNEVPYVRRRLTGSRQEKIVRPLLTDRVAIPGLGVQAILDMGGGRPHNRLRIETNKTNFRQQVRIEASDDRKHWGMIRRDGIILDVSTPDQHASNTVVSYTDSTRRYLRLTIEGWNNPEALRSVSMSFVRNSPAEREVIADQRPTPKADSGTHSSLLELDLGFERPYDLVRFDISPGFFSRALTISVSQDRKSWSTVGYGNVERTSRRERLFVTIPEQWARYVRVAVNNEDNPPLTFTRIRVEAIRTELIFPAEAAGSYWLYSGNLKAERVRYDLPMLLPADVSAVPATFGSPGKNPEYRPPKPPITERSPWLLSALLVVLVPALGAIAFRMLRQIKTTP